MDDEKTHSLSLWEQLYEDWTVHGKDFSRPGFRAMAVYRFGAWCSGLRYRLLRAPLSRLYLFLYRYVRNVYGIELPCRTKVGRRCFIPHQSGIVIHPFSEIGDDCLIRQNVTLGAASRDKPTGAPKLGNNVHIGAGAVLLGNITVGDGAKINANAVVMTNVPAGAFVFNSPPKILKNPEAKQSEPTEDQETQVLPVS
jgi:serine O-acetyltransferase